MNVQNFSHKNAKKKRKNKNKIDKKSYFYQRIDIAQTQNITKKTTSQNIIIDEHDRKNSRNQNNIHRNNRDKKIIRKNNRDDREKQSLDKFKITYYYCNKIKHLKNECKNFIVDQKTKKNSTFTTQSHL